MVIHKGFDCTLGLVNTCSKHQIRVYLPKFARLTSQILVFLKEVVHFQSQFFVLRFESHIPFFFFWEICARWAPNHLWVPSVLVFLAKLVRPESQNLVFFVTVVHFAHFLRFFPGESAPCVPNSTSLLKCVQCESQTLTFLPKFVHLKCQILVFSRELCTLSLTFLLCSCETYALCVPNPSSLKKSVHFESQILFCLGNVFTVNPSLGYRRPDARGNLCTWAPNPDILVTLAAGAAPTTKNLHYSLICLHYRNCFGINFCKANFEFSNITLQNWFWN